MCLLRNNVLVTLGNPQTSLGSLHWDYFFSTSSSNVNCQCEVCGLSRAAETFFLEIDVPVKFFNCNFSTL